MGSAHVLSLRLGTAPALGGAGTDKIPLHVGQPAERGEHQAPGARPGIGLRLRQGAELRLPAPTICMTMKEAVRQLKRSCDLSSLTSSEAHSRASVILPASLKARAFAKAWLSADRSTADSFPDRAPRALRAAAGTLRICTGPTRFRRATNLDRQRLDRNV
jgi:hypothetical protein